ncbi:6,7-dimethyl-8-ribityllumazine synthase, partial [bacterium]
MGRNFEGKFDARGKKIAVVASRFNDFFTRELMDGALDCLRRHGVSEDDIDTAWVPGGFEIPIAAKRFVQTERYAAVICVGCIIQ